MHSKASELKQAKLRALLLLLAAAAIFVVTASLRKSGWVDCLKAVSEAAMVGALADWFAVVALFKRIPIPFIAAHTAVIPRNKDKIADNLAAFVQEKFLDASSIVGLIKQHDPARQIGVWLSAPDNARLLGGHAVTFLRGMLDFTDDSKIQSFIKDAMHAAIGKLDLSKSAGAILDTLTRDGRHQALLDEAIVLLTNYLRNAGTRDMIARLIVDWLKKEHRYKEKLLPSEWIGETGAESIANALDILLGEVGADPEHRLRKEFDQAVARLITQLKTDPAVLQKGEVFKQYLKEGEALNAYARQLWDKLRDWLKNDLAQADSLFGAKIIDAGTWVGRALDDDPQLRASLNRHMENAAESMAPGLALFISRHISDTVKNWDAKQMSALIELNIGKDLQAIRFNGTIVGGIIGAVLYGVTQVLEMVRVSTGG